jgi:hypothetical protein
MSARHVTLLGVTWDIIIFNDIGNSKKREFTYMPAD